MPEAKAKIKNRHRNAIQHFRKWKKEHPKATLNEQIEMFDFLVDTTTATSMEIKDAA